MSEDSDFEYELKSAHPFSMTIFESKWRVKLYKLNLTGHWDDMGTGYVCIIKEVNFLLIYVGSRLLHKNVFRNR